MKGGDEPPITIDEMIDQFQTLMFRFCGVNFIDFWNYTPAETSTMVKIGQEKLKYEAIIHAQLLQCVSNAPHFMGRGKKPRELNEFLPDFAKEPERELTAEEIEALWWKEAE